MDLGNDQQMGGGLRVDVPEGEAMLIFINTFGLPFTGGNFTKEAATHFSHLALSVDLLDSSLFRSLMYF